MEASEAPIPPGEEECPSCGRPMSSRARLCPTCHSHRQQWKNWLAFYSGAAGWLAIIVSAVAFVSDVGPRVWNSLFRPDALKPVYFEYPGQSAFVNTGAHDIVLMSIALIVPDGEPLEIELRIGELIKPGEMETQPNSQYSESLRISSARHGCVEMLLCGISMPSRSESPSVARYSTFSIQTTPSYSFLTA